MANLLALQIADFPIAVAQALTPKLRGRPVVVVTSTRPMGRVLALSNEARLAGAKEGMLYPVARQFAPDATFLLPDREHEKRAEYALMQAAVRFTPCLERYGPGRLYLDVRGTQKLLGAPLDIASQLHHEVAERYRLAGALGISTRKIWSHLAAQVVAPTGIMELVPNRETDFLTLIPPEWVAGVGSKTIELLHDMNITNLGMLRQFSLEELLRAFGKPGKALWEAIRQSEQAERVDSVANIAALLPLNEGVIEAVVAFHEETTRPDILRAALLHAVAECGSKLRQQNRVASMIALSIGYSDGKGETVRHELSPPAALDSELLSASEATFAKAHTRRVRLCRLALRCEELSEPTRQASLFPDEVRTRELHRLAALDAIRLRFGSGGIKSAAEMLAS